MSNKSKISCFANIMKETDKLRIGTKRTDFKHDNDINTLTANVQSNLQLL